VFLEGKKIAKFREKKEKNHHIQFHSMHSFYASNACLAFGNRSIYFILKVHSQRLLVEAFERKKKKKTMFACCDYIYFLYFIYLFDFTWPLPCVCKY
jgi:hypothetical protein